MPTATEKIIKYFIKNKKLKREDVPDQFGITDAYFRKIIKKISPVIMIVNLQDGRGYYMACRENRAMLSKYILQEKKRYAEIEKNIRIAEKWLERIEKK